MNSGPTSERVYDQLKERVLLHEAAPGAHLDPAVLTEALASSVTPIREALYRLVGEGLVDMKSGGGFHMRLIDEPGLHDLYAWNQRLVLAALGAWPAGEAQRGTAAGPGKPGSDAALFAEIAYRAQNLEAQRTIAGLNDRLAAIRLVEARVLPGVPEELETFRLALVQGQRRDLRAAITRYHRRRRRTAAMILRALYRRL